MTSAVAATAAKSSIGVGIIGLSANYAWANNSHLPALLSSPHFRVTALSNRSEKNALAARTHHKLPESVSLYTSPTALAADPSVDLITVTTRVDTHYAIVKEILTSPTPKDLYVEWPLGANIAEAEELVALAEAAGVKTAVSLQGRFEENFQDVKRILDDGRIGDVLSVRIDAAAGKIVDIVHYFTDNKVGGNFATIMFGHLVDYVQSIVGEIKSYQSVTANQLSKYDILPITPNGKVQKGVDKDTLDHISVHGFLESGAFFDFFLREGKAFDPETGLKWSIYGTKGEVEISGSLLVSTGAAVVVKVKDENGNVEELPPRGPSGADVNIGKLYEGLRTGDSRIVTFKQALERHRFLESIGAYSGERRTYSQGNDN